MFVGDGSHPLDKQFRIGRFFGIPLYFHIILVIFVGFELLVGLLTMNLGRMLAPFVIMLSVYLHELGHALSSAHFGARPRRIVLHLFGGVAEVPGGLRIKQELWVIAWGPIVSLVLAVLGYALVQLLSPMAMQSGAGFGIRLLTYLSYYFFMINLILFLFNMLPIYPLDGGQLTRQWLTLRSGRQEGVRRSLPLSMAVLILAALIGLMFYGSSFGPLTFIIALMLLFVNHQEWQRHRHLFAGPRGFWGNLNPFGAKRRIRNKSYGHLRPVEDDEVGGGGLGDRIYVWWNRKNAEKVMRKSDEVGVDQLTPKERDLLERYLDAKISLRRGKKEYLN